MRRRTLIRCVRSGLLLVCLAVPERPEFLNALGCPHAGCFPLGALMNMVAVSSAMTGHSNFSWVHTRGWNCWSHDCCRFSFYKTALLLCKVALGVAHQPCDLRLGRAEGSSLPPPVCWTDPSGKHMGSFPLGPLRGCRVAFGPLKKRGPGYEGLATHTGQQSGGGWRPEHT